MLALPTVVLEHTVDGQVHYDWLLADPADPEGPLWTARVQSHPRQWPARRNWLLEPIQPHRRHYLTYQGPIGGERGSVSCVDQGSFTPIVWQNGPSLIDLALKHVIGRVSVTRLDPAHLSADLLGPAERSAVQ